MAGFGSELLFGNGDKGNGNGKKKKFGLGSGGAEELPGMPNDRRGASGPKLKKDAGSKINTGGGFPWFNPYGGK